MINPQSPLQLLSFFFIFILFVSSLVIPSFSSANNPSLNVVAPVYLDSATHLYKVSLGSSKQALLLDIGSPNIWSVCPNEQHKTTFPCNSKPCHKVPENIRSCHNHQTCAIKAYNPITKKTAPADLTYAIATFNTTDGHVAEPTLMSFPHVLSGSAPQSLVKGLPENVDGVVGLGQSSAMALHRQLPGIADQFAFCLPFNDSHPGMLILGPGPLFLHGIGFEATRYQSNASLMHDPSEPYDYFIKVAWFNISSYSIGRVSSTRVKGLTKISTLVPYTTLSTPLFQTLLKGFDNVTKQYPKVTPPIPPFSRCINVSSVHRNTTGNGPSLWDFLYVPPVIDLIIADQPPPLNSWEMLSADSLFQVSEDVMCLAYLDGGWKPKHEIVIGIYQMKERLLVVDFSANNVGISATNLNYIRGYCGDFLVGISGPSF